MEYAPDERIVIQCSATQDGGRRYVYSRFPGVPKVRVVLEKEHEDSELWNAVVDLAFFLPYADLNESQRVMQIVMCYHSEIHNGGHGQYFANEGTEHLEEMLHALHTLGAKEQHDILKAAAGTAMSKRAMGVRSVLGYVAYARQNEKYDFDRAYYHCKPSADILAVEFAKSQLDQFVKLI